MRKNFNPSTDMQFVREYPTHEVAVHEVFMSFNNDEDAVHFEEWWCWKGSTLFKTWVDKMNKDGREE